MKEDEDFLEKRTFLLLQEFVSDGRFDFSSIMADATTLHHKGSVG